MTIDPRSGLTEEQADELTEKLTAAREEIRSRARRRVAGTADADPGSQTDPRGDAADQAELGFEQGMEVELSERDTQLLHEIEAALQRMEAGTYGLSEESGDPIGVKRLRAQPWARRTQEEQEEEEELLEESHLKGAPPPG